jgi:hypothetical protein
MASENKPVKLKQGGNPGARPLIFLAAFTVLIGCFCNASAQRGNQSDWNVPPPLAPGTITRGDNDGRPGTSGKAALIFTDVTPAAQATSVVSVPELPPISTVPTEVNSPEQPVSEDALAALTDIPLPQVPEMPAMPGLSLQDVAEPLVTDIPMPAVPDMPPLPSEPTGSASQNTTSSGLLPLMPAVSASPVSFNGPPAEAVIWTTPAIPQIIN